MKKSKTPNKKKKCVCGEPAAEAPSVVLGAGRLSNEVGKIFTQCSLKVCVSESSLQSVFGKIVNYSHPLKPHISSLIFKASVQGPQHKINRKTEVGEQA